MNEWVKKSIEIANSDGYLDKLSKIYTAGVLPRRPLENSDKQQIESLHEKGHSKELVLFLLGLTEMGHPFPIEHPYASIFRQKRQFIAKNPRVFQQLEKIVTAMHVEDIIWGCERPIDLNRVMGQAFQKWISEYFPSKGIPLLSKTQFQSHNNRAFFDGKDAKIIDYANQMLGLRLTRGRDFLYKTRDKFVIGEARFLSTSGGSQNRDLIETIQFIQSIKGRITAVGIVDGIIWFNKSYVERLLKLNDDEPALTVLLLEDFLASFK